VRPQPVNQASGIKKPIVSQSPVRQYVVNQTPQGSFLNTSSSFKLMFDVFQEKLPESSTPPLYPEQNTRRRLPGTFYLLKFISYDQHSPRF
jgi:hypothetical protein